MATVYKIHPAIGIARVGNSPDYYLAPETPGGLPLDPNTGQPIYAGPGAPTQNLFHDAAGALKKQGARFRVYAYDDGDPSDLGTRIEIGSTIGGKTVTGIEWTVYLANKKASWFQFRELTGSGQEGDLGYLKNNAANPGGDNPNKPYNPIRENQAYGLSSDPAALGDPARMQLVLDPGPRTVARPNAAPLEFDITSKGLQPFDITTLGRIFTDTQSNLIVLAGEGRSGTTDTDALNIKAFANNSGWFDDVSDGPVSGALLLDDGSKVPIDVPAWVLCGPPGYAPEIINVVSLYDTMYDLFVREFGLNPAIYKNGRFQASYEPDMAAEITPLLRRPNLYQYVADIPANGRQNHAELPADTAQQFQANVERLLRRPHDKNNTPHLMPRLAGDNPRISRFNISEFLTLTATQYFILTQFASGIFMTGAPVEKGEGVLLDQASLENCVGGGFSPGIEMTWLARNKTIYMPLPTDPSLSDAFRFRHKDVTGGLTLTNGANNDYTAGLEPGDIIKYMAQPWQADFNDCTTQPFRGTSNLYWWWPAQRPYAVYPVASPTEQRPWTRLTVDGNDQNDTFPNLQMVTNWKDVGFILNIAPAGNLNLVEVERNQKAISDYQPPAGV